MLQRVEKRLFSLTLQNCVCFLLTSAKLDLIFAYLSKTGPLFLLTSAKLGLIFAYLSKTGSEGRVLGPAGGDQLSKFPRNVGGGEGRPQARLHSLQNLTNFAKLNINRKNI